MAADSWLSRIKLKRKQKREMKMKEALSFLMDEIKETENRVITRITTEMEHNILPQMEDSVQKMNHHIDELSYDLRESNRKMEDLVVDVKKQCIGNHDVAMENLRLIIEKIEQADANIGGAQKQTESLLRNEVKAVTSGINELSYDLRESNGKMEDLVVDVKKQCIGNRDAAMENLRLIIEKIEQAAVNIGGAQRQTESLLRNEAKTVTLGIDEIKSLLQLLAVNNLLDEINIEE